MYPPLHDPELLAMPYLGLDMITGLVPDCSPTYQDLSLESAPLFLSPLLLLSCLTPNYSLCHH